MNKEGVPVSKTQGMAHSIPQPEPDISHVENMLYTGADKPDHMDYRRVDSEVAKYTSEVLVHISDEENTRLKKLIDRRVLVIMIFTYFMQALDKGTLAFTSIMGIRTDAHVSDVQVLFDLVLLYISNVR